MSKNGFKDKEEENNKKETEKNKKTDTETKNEIHHHRLSTGAIVGLIFAAILAIVAIIVGVELYQTSRGGTNVITQERGVSSFKKVSLNGFGRLTIKQGPKESLEVRTNERIIDNINIQVINDTLNIGQKNQWAFWDFLINKDVDFYLTVKDLNEITVSGAGSVYASSLTLNDLKLTINGSGSDNLNLTAIKIDSNISGSGNITFSGKTIDQNLTITGSGDYKSNDLSSKFTEITINGSGNVKVNVDTKLKVNISGSGNVLYLGNPEVSQNVAGSGSVKKINN